MPVYSDCNPIFSDLHGVGFDALYRSGKKECYLKNTIILKEGDQSSSFYVIDSGKLKVFLSDEHGKEIVLNILEAGEYFGEMSLLDGEVRSASVMTLEDSQLNVIPKKNFDKCVAKYPEVSRQLMQGFSRMLRKSTKKVGSLALLDVYGRVVNILIQFSRKQKDGRFVFNEKMTYQNIANLVGVSHEIVTRVLRDLAADGHITVDAERRIILNVFEGHNICRVSPLSRLSQRELAVARLFGQGKSSKEIALQLDIAPSTARNFLSSAYKKLNINDKAELAVLINGSEI